jgi:hypothetical protein
MRGRVYVLRAMVRSHPGDIRARDHGTYPISRLSRPTGLLHIELVQSPALSPCASTRRWMLQRSDISRTTRCVGSSMPARWISVTFFADLSSHRMPERTDCAKSSRLYRRRRCGNGARIKDRKSTSLVAGRPIDAAIFLRSDGKPWGVSQQRPLAEACARARISPAVSFHILRHSDGSALAMRGVPMGVIAAQLGHSDTRMTEKHYAILVLATSPTRSARIFRRARHAAARAPRVGA